MLTKILAAVVLMLVIAAISIATVSLVSRPMNVESPVDLSLPARPQLLEVARINAQLHGSDPAAGAARLESPVDLSLPARPQLLEVARINARLHASELLGRPYEFVPPAR
jgi:hypothetical protein